VKPLPQGNQGVVFLARRNAGPLMIFQFGGANVKPGGSFDISGVQPGNYILQSFPGAPFLIHLPVEVKDRDVNGLAVQPLNRIAAAGHVRFDGTGEPRSARIAFRAVDPVPFDSGEWTNSKPDGTFVLNNLWPVRFAVQEESEAGLYVESITVDGREALDQVVDLSHGSTNQIEIRIAQGTGQIDGKLRLPDAVPGQAAIPQATAMLVSASGITGNTGARSAPIDPNGRFQFALVPPGRWYVFAIPHFNEDPWQNMDFVRAIAGQGTAVDVPKSGSVQVEVSPISLEDLRRASDGVGR
jgi:hypothetical protein